MKVSVVPTLLAKVVLASAIFTILLFDSVDSLNVILPIRAVRSTQIAELPVCPSRSDHHDDVAVNDAAATSRFVDQARRKFLLRPLILSLITSFGASWMFSSHTAAAAAGGAGGAASEMPITTKSTVLSGTVTLPPNVVVVGNNDNNNDKDNQAALYITARPNTPDNVPAAILSGTRGKSPPVLAARFANPTAFPFHFQLVLEDHVTVEGAVSMGGDSTNLWWSQDDLLVSARWDQDGVAATRSPEDLVGRGLWKRQKQQQQQDTSGNGKSNNAVEIQLTGRGTFGKMVTGGGGSGGGVSPLK